MNHIFIAFLFLMLSLIFTYRSETTSLLSLLVQVGCWLIISDFVCLEMPLFRSHFWRVLSLDIKFYIDGLSFQNFKKVFLCILTSIVLLKNCCQFYFFAGQLFFSHASHQSPPKQLPLHFFLVWVFSSFTTVHLRTCVVFIYFSVYTHPV